MLQLNEKDDELKRANDYNENIDKQYRQLLAQLEHETALQHEKLVFNHLFLLK